MKCLAAVHQQNPAADLRGCTCCWVLGIMLDMGLGKCCTWQLEQCREHWLCMLLRQQDFQDHVRVCASGLLGCDLR